MASPNPSIYRQAALDKLSNPEDLDRLLGVTTVRGWLVLVAIGLVLLIVALWAVFGEIATTVSANGILTVSNPTEMIAAPTAGQVVDITAQADSQVSAGQVVAHISAAGSDKPLDVVSQFAGRVLSIRANVGSPVSAGTPVLSVEKFSGSQQGLEAVAFVPLDEAQQLRPGMSVEISPSTIQREEYGYLLGTVDRVASVAATSTEIASALGATSAVYSLPSGVPLFEVRVALSKASTSTNSAQGYQWSASAGPAVALVSGTPCQITITTKQERPISRALSLQAS